VKAVQDDLDTVVVKKNYRVYPSTTNSKKIQKLYFPDPKEKLFINIQKRGFILA